MGGRRVVVIGGGPAGSLTALQIVRLTHQRNIDAEVTILEHKAFQTPGAAGCNFCAGVVTARTMERLEELGIQFPAPVLQRKIEGFRFICEGGSMDFQRPVSGGIYTVFRGGGPRLGGFDHDVSFDSCLLDKAREEGATVRVGQAVGIRTLRRGLAVLTRDGDELPAEIVVGAFGVNSHLGAHLFEPLGYAPPRTINVCQAEVHLDDELIDRRFGDRIAVLTLRDPAIRFLAITPKRNYLTLTAVGENVKMSQLREYMRHPEVQTLIGVEEARGLRGCHCHPMMPVSTARGYLRDRFIAVGDACASRYYKNGLGSALYSATIAARAVARAMVRRDCRLDTAYRDFVRSRFIPSNAAGKLLFFINDLVYKQPQIAAATLEFVNRERDRRGSVGPMQGLMWSLFTGDRPYTAILKHAFNPLLAVRMLVWYIRSSIGWFSAWLMKQASAR